MAEEWSNDAENSALHHMSKLHLKYIQIENRYFKLKYYSTILYFSFVFLIQ